MKEFSYLLIWAPKNKKHTHHIKIKEHKQSQYKKHVVMHRSNPYSPEPLIIRNMLSPLLSIEACEKIRHNHF